jgi:hypothetical protein
MGPSNEQTNTQEAVFILAEIVELRQELAEFRLELKADFIEVNLAFDRIDGHLNDTCQSLSKAAAL